jgi:hypothetical protein
MVSPITTNHCQSLEDAWFGASSYEGAIRESMKHHCAVDSSRMVGKPSLIGKVRVARHPPAIEASSEWSSKLAQANFRGVR